MDLRDGKSVPDDGGPCVTARRRIQSGPWLELHEATYRDAGGHERNWSYVARTGETQAVAVLARHAAGPVPQWVLVRQFRPPVGRWVWELPAGLVDPGESPEETALRELREETGFEGEVTGVGPLIFSSPGLTTECMRIVEVAVTSRGPANPELSEAIEVHLVPVTALCDHLLAAHARGDAIDAKLWMLAGGG